MAPSQPPPKAETKPEEAKPAEGAEKKEGDATAAPEGEAKPEAAKEPPAAEQKPEEPPKQQEQQYEIKIRERKNYTDIKFQTSSFALTPAIKRNFGDLENKMFKEDMDILSLKAIKNDLEAYSYKMRDICGSYGSHEKYIDPSIKEDFLS